MGDLFRESLLEASFEGVAFPVEAESGEFGHDLVEHTARLRDGADLEPTGWKALRGTLTAVFINGVEGQQDLFPRRYEQLRDAIRAHPIGDLVHPVDGLLRACIKVVKRETSGNERGGCRVHLEWVEHNASASSLAQFSGAPATDAPTTAIQRADDADTEMAAVDSTGGYASLGDATRAGLAYLEGDQRTYADIAATLRSLEDAVAGNEAMAAFAGVDGYAVAAALSAYRATLNDLRNRYLPQTDRVRFHTVASSMPDWQVALEVYGDARHAPLIRQANGWMDYSAIPAGTELVILPAD